MRKTLIVALLLPAIMLGGCSLFGGGQSVDTAQVAARRTSPLVIPSTFTLPPPAQAAATAPGR